MKVRIRTALPSEGTKVESKGESGLLPDLSKEGRKLHGGTNYALKFSPGERSRRIPRKGGITTIFKRLSNKGSHEKAS